MNNKFYSIAGLVSVGLFALCVLWKFVLVDPALQQLHLQFLQVTFPGFSFAIGGLIIGAVESFVYGFLLGILFKWFVDLASAKN